MSPTRERIAKAHGHIDKPQVDQKTKRDAWRLISVVEGMLRRGWLSEEQKIAFERFATDFTKAEHVRSMICGYGQHIPSTRDEDGTPWDPLDHKIAAHKRAMAAMEAVSYPRIVDALKHVVTEETTLEKIGRQFAMETNKNAAIAAGKQMLQIGTYALLKHYERLNYRRDPP